MSAVARLPAARAVPAITMIVAALSGAGWWMANQPPGGWGPPPGGGWGAPPGGGQPPGPPGWVPPPGWMPPGQQLPPPPPPPPPPQQASFCSGCDLSACGLGDFCADTECACDVLDCLSGIDCDCSRATVTSPRVIQRYAPSLIVVLAPLFLLSAWRRRASRHEPSTV